MDDEKDNGAPIELDSAPRSRDSSRLFKSAEPSPEQHPLRRAVRYAVGIVGLFIVAIVLYSLAYAVMSHPEDKAIRVLTVCGEVEGKRDNQSDFAVFRGIPYAAPPIGSLRWQPAQPASCRSKPLLAYTSSPRCITLPANPNEEQSEDCLYLDIWTPNHKAEPVRRAPTLVWIHGGDNVFGNRQHYKGIENLARLGKTCLVTINYRLGAFGYMALAELSAIDRRNVSGNYGLTDIQSALRWIQDNIRQFGCDASRVTLLGHSSGATNALALLTNPINTGLFRAVIALSASTNMSMDLKTAERQNIDFLNRTGCQSAANVTGCLLGLSPEAVNNAVPASWLSLDALPTSPNGTNNSIGLIINDGVTVPTNLSFALSFATVDVSVFLQSLVSELEPFLPPRNDTPDEFNQFLITNFQSWPNSTTGQQIAEAYNLTTQTQGVETSYFNILSDLGIFCSHVQLAKSAASRRNSPLYVSLVKQGPQAPLVFQGTEFRHPVRYWDLITASQTWDLFTSWTNDPPYSPQLADVALGDRIREQWLNITWNGVLPSNLLPFKNVVGFPANYSVLQQGDQVQTSQRFSNVTNSFKERSDFCDIIQGYVDPWSDGRFWWSN